MDPVLAAGLATTAAAGGFAAAWPSRDKLMRARMRKTVVATLKTGATFRGVLFEMDGRTVILRNAEAIGADPGKHIPVDGELLLSRADVEFLQRP